MSNTKIILRLILNGLENDLKNGKTYKTNTYEREWYKGYTKAKLEDYKIIKKYLERME